MANFVELWVYLASAPLFGLTATLAVYVLAQALSVRSGHAPWANPVMVSVAEATTPRPASMTPAEPIPTATGASRARRAAGAPVSMRVVTEEAMASSTA